MQLIPCHRRRLCLRCQRVSPKSWVPGRHGWTILVENTWLINILLRGICTLPCGRLTGHRWTTFPGPGDKFQYSAILVGWDWVQTKRMATVVGLHPEYAMVTFRSCLLRLKYQDSEWDSDPHQWGWFWGNNHGECRHWKGKWLKYHSKGRRCLGNCVEYSTRGFEAQPLWPVQQKILILS